jgi:hypothetical protein
MSTFHETENNILHIGNFIKSAFYSVLFETTIFLTIHAPKSKGKKKRYLWSYLELCPALDV